MCLTSLISLYVKYANLICSCGSFKDIISNVVRYQFSTSINKCSNNYLIAMNRFKVIGHEVIAPWVCILLHLSTTFSWHASPSTRDNAHVSLSNSIIDYKHSTVESIRSSSCFTHAFRLYVLTLY